MAIDLHMAHADSYSGYYGSYGNAFLFGYTINYTDYGASYGPYWNPSSYDGSEGASFSRTGNDIAWSSEFTDQDVEYFYIDEDCTVGDGVSGVALEAAGGGAYEATGSLDCTEEGQGTVDVYSVTLAADGDVTITVDTVADATTFDPWFVVNDSAGCSIFGADDSFACTFPPPKYDCPAGTLTATAGTYEIIVQNYGNCAGDVAEYKLTVDADADPNLIK